MIADLAADADRTAAMKAGTFDCRASVAANDYETYTRTDVWGYCSGAFGGEASWEAFLRLTTPGGTPRTPRAKRSDQDRAAMRLRFCAVVVIAAITPALAGEPVYCSTSFQGYRVCSGPDGAAPPRPTGHDHRPGQPGRSLDDLALARRRHHRGRASTMKPLKSIKFARANLISETKATPGLYASRLGGGTRSAVTFRA